MGTLRIVVGSAVTVVWVAAYGQAIVRGADTYPPAELSAVMTLVVTALFATELRERARRALGSGNGKRDGDG